MAGPLGGYYLVAEVVTAYCGTDLWKPILMLSLALGLWGIWNTTEPARRSRAIEAISVTWLSPGKSSLCIYVVITETMIIMIPMLLGIPDTTMKSSVMVSTLYTLNLVKRASRLE